VYDASSGALLKEIDVGSSIVAAPVTYAIDGEQYIAVMAAIGGAPLTYAPPPGSAAFEYGNSGRILAFKLDGAVTPLPPRLPAVAAMPKPPALEASPQRIAHGAALYAAYCRSCHRNSPRGAAPDLRRMTNHDLFQSVVRGGAYRSRDMPQWDDLLSVEDVEDIHAYVISEAQAAYQNEKSVNQPGVTQ
jgi:quinohemoprotein ethanol dehydrogenase